MTEEVGLFRASSAIAPALPYYLYPYRHDLWPSGHLHKAQMFKFVPDEFVEPSGFIHPTFPTAHKKTPIKGLFYVWRKRWDLNPRRAINPCQFSRLVLSTAQPPFLNLNVRESAYITWFLQVFNDNHWFFINYFNKRVPCFNSYQPIQTLSDIYSQLSKLTNLTIHWFLISIRLQWLSVMT